MVVFTTSNVIVGKIIEVFEGIRKKPEDDKFNELGKAALEEILMCFIVQDKPVKFVLPAFPCKSPNTIEKVLGTMPDKGEEIALKNLDEFCRRVTDIYNAGCELLIVSDGTVFADIVGVPDDVVTRYNTAVRDLVVSSHLKFTSLDNFFQETTHEGMRKKLVDQYSTPISEIRELIKASDDKRRLYCGLTRFLREDRIWPDGRSRNSIQEECKEKAIQMMQRNAAYSNLVAEAFPRYIRLSIHPHSNRGEKFGINLISNSDEWGTPWHNVLMLKKDGSCQLMKRKEAEERKYKLLHENGRPSYFVE